MKTLFLSSNTEIEASVRYRVYQFLDDYHRAGHQSLISHFFDPRGGRFRRVVKGFLRRTLDLLRAKSVDRIFIHREALPLSLNEYVRLLPRDKEIIFDFDDSVFLSWTDGNADSWWRRKIRRPESTRLLVQRAAVTYAGNEFLADYASRFSSNVQVIPTVVDTERFKPGFRQKEGLPVVGWVGSPSTSQYLDGILDSLDEVAREVPFELLLVGAGREFQLENAPVRNLTWKLENELDYFQAMDVGLYPMSDDLWSRGKCGFKAIQYMACGIPFVVSPVGVIQSMVRDGVDGLWARNPQEWKDGLVSLLRQESAAKTMALEGRRRAVEHYSLASLAPRWIQGIVEPLQRVP